MKPKAKYASMKSMAGGSGRYADGSAFHAVDMVEDPHTPSTKRPVRRSAAAGHKRIRDALHIAPRGQGEQRPRRAGRDGDDTRPEHDEEAPSAHFPEGSTFANNTSASHGRKDTSAARTKPKDPARFIVKSDVRRWLAQQGQRHHSFAMGDTISGMGDALSEDADDGETEETEDNLSREADQAGVGHSRAATVDSMRVPDPDKPSVAGRTSVPARPAMSHNSKDAPRIEKREFQERERQPVGVPGVDCQLAPGLKRRRSVHRVDSGRDKHGLQLLADAFDEIEKEHKEYAATDAKGAEAVDAAARQLPGCNSNTSPSQQCADDRVGVSQQTISSNHDQPDAAHQPDHAAWAGHHTVHDPPGAAPEPRSARGAQPDLKARPATSSRTTVHDSDGSAALSREEQRREGGGVAASNCMHAGMEQEYQQRMQASPSLQFPVGLKGPSQAAGLAPTDTHMPHEATMPPPVHIATPPVHIPQSFQGVKDSGPDGWEARIRVDRKLHILGKFADAQDAARAYDLCVVGLRLHVVGSLNSKPLNFPVDVPTYENHTFVKMAREDDLCGEELLDELKDFLQEQQGTLIPHSLTTMHQPAPPHAFATHEPIMPPEPDRMPAPPGSRGFALPHQAPPSAFAPQHHMLNGDPGALNHLGAAMPVSTMQQQQGDGSAVSNGSQLNRYYLNPATGEIEIEGSYLAGGMLGQDDDFRKRGRRSSVKLTKEMLQQYFDEPLEEAARKLGTSMTTLKKTCRTFGIRRWPFRKVQAMKKLQIQHKETPQDPLSVARVEYLARQFTNGVVSQSGEHSSGGTGDGTADSGHQDMLGASGHMATSPAPHPGPDKLQYRSLAAPRQHAGQAVYGHGLPAGAYVQTSSTMPPSNPPVLFIPPTPVDVSGVRSCDNYGRVGYAPFMATGDAGYQGHWQETMSYAPPERAGSGTASMSPAMGGTHGDARAGTHGGLAQDGHREMLDDTTRVIQLGLPSKDTKHTS